MKKIKHTFEEKYFTDHYSHISDFSEKAEKTVTNWFKGLFHTINSYSKILNGTNKTAIEFGCATGVASKLLADSGYNVTSTDISLYAVKKAKKLYSNIHFLKHDIQDPFISKIKYDLVLALDVIEHLENPNKAIKNMYNLIKPNGLVLCSTPNDYAHERKVPTHISVKTPQEWKKLFYDAGFKSVEIRQKTFLPFLYRLHWRLTFSLPFAINLHFPIICSPVFIFARK
ncbi:MAG: class I SAM-dependent methyltransferase [Candidatus Parcubacteria bacterium]|nr:class I SAM-dependent methyltransferase [Candidatus Parcubacteria bacterium]